MYIKWKIQFHNEKAKKRKKKIEYKAVCEQGIKEKILFHACVTYVQKDFFLWVRLSLSLSLSLSS